MQLLEGVVVEALVAQVEDQVGAQLGQVPLQRAVIVEVAELVVRQLGQRVLELADGVEILGVEGAVALDLVGQAVVAHQDRHVERLQLALLAAHWQVRGVGG